MKKGLFFTALYFVSVTATAELSSISDIEMSNVSGQGGVYLSGDISINENGGPIQNAHWGDCSDELDCGARIAYQTREDGGWFVMDNIRGKFSFQGLTLKVRHIDSGFGGDGASFNRDVLEIGLPDIVRFEDVTYKYAMSSTARPGGEQTDIYGIEMNGDVVMEGNVLVFPTGNP